MSKIFKGVVPCPAVPLEQYVETRFNLLKDLIELGDKTVKELLTQCDRELHNLMEDQAKLSLETTNGLKADLVSQKELFYTVHDASKRAVDKAEAAQLAHNTAANEWRATLTAFQSATVNRPEFDRFYSEFSAFRLEASRLQSLSQGADAGVHGLRKDNAAQWALIVAIVVAVVAVINSGILSRLAGA